jgi:hypothetical protein
MKEMTLKDFMEDYLDPIAKSKSPDKEKLKKIYTILPDLAIEESREKWTEITNKAMETEDYKASCKSCHSEFKKPYKKTYRKRLVSIPMELLDELKKK